MILLVTGTRTLTSKVSNEVLARSPSAQTATFLVVGDADGPDAHAKAWAEARGVHGAVLQADWTKHGPPAGPIRNTRLVHRALDEARRRNLHVSCLALWDGNSAGTLDTITKAQAHGIPLEVWVVQGGPPRQATPSELAHLITKAQARRAQRRTS